MSFSDAEILPRGSSKRTRKSLCHVPSPVVTEQRDEPSSQASPYSDAPKGLQVNICLDDDYNEHTTSGHKRRKKRQSMELPMEWVQEHANSVEASDQTRNAPSALGSSQKDGHRSFVGDTQNMKDLQALVREYCKVPKENRSSCKEAEAIEQSTGYPLTFPENNNEHPLRLSNRRSIIQKMTPIIEEIDKRKAEEIDKWEHETECRVERSRSGKYRYISIETNTKVGSQEYKRRYMSVLEREASLRLAKANEWKDKLSATTHPRQEPGTKGVPSDEDLESLDYFNPLVTDYSSDTEDCDNSSARTQELDLDLNEILALDRKSSEETEQECATQRAGEEEETSMELCDLSVSMDLGEHSDDIRAEFQSPNDSSKPEEPEDDNKEDDLDEDSILGAACTEHGEEMSHRKAPKSVSPTEMDLLPFPDRDEESSDPDIAKAERKLWCRIDAALQDYSQEVMMIMNSRRAAGEPYAP